MVLRGLLPLSRLGRRPAGERFSPAPKPGPASPRRGATLLPPLVIALSLCPPLAADDFQVNTYTTGAQDWPALSMHGSGAFVVVWGSDGSGETDTLLDSVHARRFTSSATPIGDQFQVNTVTGGYQRFPGVAMDAGGNFVVVWQDSSRDDIFAQRYAAGGAPIGAEIQVSTDPVPLPDPYFGRPAVAMDAAGGFLVVWNDDDTVQAQRFQPTGSPIGSQFRVDTFASTPGHPFWHDVAMASNGDFVVAWSSYGSPETDSDFTSVKARLYAKNGAAIGAEFQVNAYTTGEQSFPGVGMDDNANFVVVWHSNGSADTDSEGLSVQARRYAAGGVPVGGEFQVNAYTTSHQAFARVAMNGAGLFVVTWGSLGSAGTDADGWSVQARRYAATGAAIGAEFQVNTYVTGWQVAPFVRTDDEGELAVAWVSHGSSGTDTDLGSIQVFTSRMFAGGFESGDTAGWSATVP